AGREAGLATGAMDRAIAEHGLALLSAHPDEGSHASGVVRAGHEDPSQLVFEQSADGELPLSEADRLVRLLADATGGEGSTTWFPPALLWQRSGFFYRLEA